LSLFITSLEGVSDYRAQTKRNIFGLYNYRLVADFEVVKDIF